MGMLELKSRRGPEISIQIPPTSLDICGRPLYLVRYCDSVNVFMLLYAVVDIPTSVNRLLPYFKLEQKLKWWSVSTLLRDVATQSWFRCSSAMAWRSSVARTIHVTVFRRMEMALRIVHTTVLASGLGYNL